MGERRNRRVGDAPNREVQYGETVGRVVAIAKGPKHGGVPVGAPGRADGRDFRGALGVAAGGQQSI